MHCDLWVEDPEVCQVFTIGIVGKDCHLDTGMPMICEPLVSQPIYACVKDNEHLASLDLADYSVVLGFGLRLLGRVS